MREDLWSTGEAPRKHICLIAGRRKKRGLEGGSEDRRGVKVVRDLVNGLELFCATEYNHRSLEDREQGAVFGKRGSD
ncbi:hypothetical protein PHLCEN_2v3353 [Hermanssonia centrifuga]|uniref:Uncharacterized protein n=1 Tax=Hermanssonia centrifuga TaxID=98765 RepID=A0A2R6QM63_9APHY|nr:hypothetical protein PHLCEN_2v3353 [Hermanssonia centrifuga]